MVDVNKDILEIRYLVFLNDSSEFGMERSRNYAFCMI
jgi:hypothetical protein